MDMDMEDMDMEDMDMDMDPTKCKQATSTRDAWGMTSKERLRRCEGEMARQTRRSYAEAC